jgi:hypothetical protein
MICFEGFGPVAERNGNHHGSTGLSGNKEGYVLGLKISFEMPRDSCFSDGLNKFPT